MIDSLQQNHEIIYFESNFFFFFRDIALTVNFFQFAACILEQLFCGINELWFVFQLTHISVVWRVCFAIVYKMIKRKLSFHNMF